MNEKTKKGTFAPTFDAAEREEIRKNYNICNLIRAMMGESVDIGYETEISQEMVARGATTSNNGVYHVPYCALVRSMTGKTNVDGQITGNGAALIATDLMADEYISPLVGRLVLKRAGVRFLDGLRGDIAIPKGGNVSAYWVTAENGDAQQSSPAFSQVTGTPHTVAARVDLTRKLCLQSPLAVQQLIGDLILGAIAREIDRAGRAGAGSSGEPLGLLNTPGITEVENITPGSPTHADLVEFMAAIDDANVDADNLAWIASARVKACLARTIDAQLVKNVAGDENVGAVTPGRYLYEDGKAEEYPLIQSNLAPAKKLILGDWSQLMIGGWGDGIDLTVDPYSLSTKGALRLVAFKDVDVLVRYPEAFSVGTILA